MHPRIPLLAAFACLAAFAAPALAQKPAALKWGPAPPVLPHGAKVAVVSGDPFKPGPYVLQLQMPNGYVVPPHWHPTDEHVKLMSGRFNYGMADKVDAKATTALKPGESVNLKANMHHYAMAHGRTKVEISGDGPFQITYVNPADDPQHTKTK